VYDKSGTNITATVGNKYQITYATNATNVSNYQGATYQDAPTNATMIKVVNTANIQPGEKVVITFDYVVDEDQNSVITNPQKLGAVNDFMPYYYFQAGSAGWTNGTRVGASLQIGKISGIVFGDVDGDGVYTSGNDTLLTNKMVHLYQKNGSGNYLFLTGILTTAAGKYDFINLRNGDYKIDFNAVKTATYYFTKKGTDPDPARNSIVEPTGTNSGSVININPTTTTSKTVNA
jgi:hypothetical protein